MHFWVLHNYITATHAVGALKERNQGSTTSTLSPTFMPQCLALSITQSLVFGITIWNYNVIVNLLSGPSYPKHLTNWHMSVHYQCNRCKLWYMSILYVIVAFKLLSIKASFVLSIVTGRYMCTLGDKVHSYIFVV